MTVEAFKTILSSKSSSQDEKEQATLQICSAIPTTEIPIFLKHLPTSWSEISLARTTKILTKILNSMANDTTKLELINSLINLYENKALLKLDLECKKIELLLNLHEHNECLTSITKLIRELKKHDDKINLINLYVCESRCFYELKNNSRAKTSLTSARALAVSTFCPLEVQAQIDLLTGMYVCDDCNYETGFSYFLESIDGFIIEKKPGSLKVLKYLILCKIMSEKNSEVNLLMKKFEEKVNTDEEVKVLIKINQCCVDRDLNEYKKIVGYITDDFLRMHLNFLYDRVLEENILKIIEPYININIKYVSEKINLDIEIVEKKMRMMILDGRINGILDHVNMCINIFDSIKEKKEKGKAELIDELIGFTSKMKGQ